ncbi:MAG: hypothetical protein M1840_008303 [Geoglossum simile]|nr:MAG: hypothetical protein M1840_008303 [Geoglossum simile]
MSARRHSPLSLVHMCRPGSAQKFFSQRRCSWSLIKLSIDASSGRILKDKICAGCLAMVFPKPASYLAIAACVFLFAGLAAATTRFDDREDNCTIYGDVDVYGPGIRLGYYLQWVAVLFATWMAPDQAKTARTAANIITIAVFTNTFRGATHGSLVAAEWWIVLWLTLVLSLLNFPTDKAAFKQSTGSVGVMLLLWCMITAAQPWLYFKGLDQGHKDGCVVKVFFFTGINVYNHVWRTLWKIGSVIECLVGFSFLLAGIGTILWGFFGVKNEAGSRENESHGDLASIFTKASLTFGQLVLGTITIVQVEMTIKVNKINLSSNGSGLLSSGQFIPFLIGLLTIVAVFGRGLQSLTRSIIHGGGNDMGVIQLATMKRSAEPGVTV